MKVPPPPGHELRFRETLLSTLGSDVYKFFFDRYLYHFFNEKDVKLLTSPGLNCLRIAFDYRHFENDMDPTENTLATDWTGFETLIPDGHGGHKKAGIFPNSAYSCHDYGVYGFPQSERYIGTAEQKKLLRDTYEHKVSFMKRNHLCIWNGEFSPVYANEEDDGPDWLAINVSPMDMLEYQVQLYESEKISLSMEGYRIPRNGLHPPQTHPGSHSSTTWLQKKQKLNLDYWGNRPQPDVVQVIQTHRRVDR
ncbi:hypothetical protein EV426DRAFT_669088 [Tirmania nivea]|nr:hypothetical protein EV426DRAFT_669088 [Tirmania nivea]